MRATTNNRFRRAGRPGFTLVELMVMAAVCVLIMAILASVFQSGIDTMRHMRATGDMSDQLRTAGVVLRQDLAADHFLPDQQTGNPSERTRLSDYRFDQTGTTPPRGGFFKIVSPASILEGADADGLVSYRANNHQLHFTAVLLGGKDERLFSATVAGSPPPTMTTHTSRMAEIAYFLVPDVGQFTNGPPGPAPADPNSQQLYKLIRRQRLVPATSADQATMQAATGTDATGSDVISIRGGNQVNMMTDLTQPANRMALAPLTSTTPVNRVGDDILMSNVISFEVKVLWIPGTGMPAPAGFTASVSTDHPYDNLSTLPAPYSNTFDTGSTPAPQIRVKALQIRLRVFDGKLKTARQSTFVVEM